jgi:hypothetical protein
LEPPWPMRCERAAADTRHTKIAIEKATEPPPQVP